MSSRACHDLPPKSPPARAGFAVEPRQGRPVSAPKGSTALEHFVGSLLRVGFRRTAMSGCITDHAVEQRMLRNGIQQTFKLHQRDDTFIRGS